MRQFEPSSDYSHVVMDEYRTIKAAANAEFIEKRSRFIGHIMPLSDETAAAEFINRIKKEHWDARHNVYAYSLKEGNLRRYSDDGEPKGTAGVPVLDVLVKENLVDCALVVTRYFGGVLLGAGGLLRAYSHTAKLAVDSGGIVTMKRCALLLMTVDYSQYDVAQKLLEHSECTVKNAEFGVGVDISFSLENSKKDEFEIKLRDTFSGSVSLKEIGTEYAPFPQKP